MTPEEPTHWPLLQVVWWPGLEIALLQQWARRCWKRQLSTAKPCACNKNQSHQNQRLFLNWFVSSSLSTWFYVSVWVGQFVWKTRVIHLKILQLWKNKWTLTVSQIGRANLLFFLQSLDCWILVFLYSKVALLQHSTCETC